MENKGNCGDEYGICGFSFGDPQSKTIIISGGVTRKKKWEEKKGI